MKENTPRFIIYAPPYNEDSGGSIVLHKLCHVLNDIGYPAYLYPNQHGTKSTRLKQFRSLFRKKPYTTFPAYNTPVATRSMLNKDAIVIYPETDYGNPLGAHNVVRWLLHKPGFHTGEVKFGENELIYVFDDYCVEPGYNIDPNNKLFVLSVNPAYHQEGVSTTREGSCYMLRKAKGTPLVHDQTHSIPVDGLSHAETAEIFRKTKYFYCYDEFTLYSQFAALCGCISVVIPKAFPTRDAWVEKHPISRFGIAYGTDDIAHAVATQDKVAEYFNNLETESRETVLRFAQNSRSHFNLK
ncbi:MAG: hypothetical protein H6999_02640 [Hahellaceae bacterium]|nr:hypothetical protein [Hahellaceae bacterium]MCP5168640.1 hypothetical protein [Hahellaceae bacterium]